MDTPGAEMNPQEQSFWNRYNVLSSEWPRTLARIGVPERYRAVDQSLELHPAVVKWTGEPTFVTYLGAVGSGKTWQATRLLGELKCCGWDARWFDTSLALQQVLGEIGTDQDGRTLRSLMETEVILLDDVLAERDTPFNLDKLSLILRQRYNRQLATIITSNSMDREGRPSLDGIRQLEPRLASRLSEGIVIKIGGKDRRLPNGPKRV